MTSHENNADLSQKYTCVEPVRAVNHDLLVVHLDARVGHWLLVIIEGK